MSVRSDLSLSYLDLVTCSFGGVTLLFLILLAVQGPLVNPAPAEEGGAGRHPISPWVIELEADESATGSPWIHPDENPWLVRFDRKLAPRTGFGPRQALLILDRPPDSHFSARVGPVKPAARLRVTYLIQGERQVIERPATEWGIDEQGRLQLWPIRFAALHEGEAP